MSHLCKLPYLLKERDRSESQASIALDRRNKILGQPWQTG